MIRKISALLLVFILILSLAGCGLSEPRPEIREAEFNFSVTYEYLGEVNTVSGVYVCEYDGIGWVLDGGYYIEWNGYIKDGAVEEIIPLGVAEDGSEVELCLYFDEDLLMGGEAYMEGDTHFSPLMSVTIYDEGIAFECDPEVVAEVYGARIISSECDPPIENSFSTKYFP